mmetsp:Transcript_49129/g.54923  ORF Transcript_49129/g.54923 Transcript_49129/m.54923 type:complete len:703 (-) Transcript_49129:315-2423(-)|eukprot:CAMPEP_0170798386 /NCGR_PEP_ID=MMETSP0733-20121128/26298_1 /TAXON_ID=186038 /ORGANISM="Fragilariopsis kerguelensis, Strain L26-C5" /LENGTH=702 /DNA_ID=CAMNT_0011149675 /DNA_START=17 /DNA_END=2125 /DNA_ORIENTATION=-
MDKNSLLASLIGDQLIGDDDGAKTTANTEQDLFGDIAIDEPVSGDFVGSLPPETAVTQAQLQYPFHTEARDRPVSITDVKNTSVTPIASPPAPVDSLLSKSGLLGVSNTAGNSGGLFDEVDDECRDIEAKNEACLKKEIGNFEAEMKQEDQQLRMHQQQSLDSPYPKQDHVQVNPDTSAHTYEQQSAIMQSAVMTQGQMNGQMSAMNLNNPDDSGFYREHSAPVGQNIDGSRTATPNEYRTAPHNSGGYFYGTREQEIHHPSNQQQQQNYSGSFAHPSSTAGMHNSDQKMNLGRIRKITLVKPQDVAPLYVDIRVTEPMLIQTQSFLISSSPYWSYQITSHLAGNQGTWLVRRRFRHVVALEDRLRQSCPGCIIPPRPDKHASRALEEASTQQSAEFAVQRAKELELYLNQVAKHPVAGQSQVMRLFLGLQDDIGTAWPEVSANAFTRLGAVGAGVSIRVAESTNLTAASAPAHEWEEDAELLGLCSSETLRIGAVSQAVPKLEGTIIILREQGDAAGILGMELSKASKTLDIDYKFYDILSSGLLRHGRRTKRLALELSAAMDSFLQQYKLVRYEKMAMQDRRLAIQRKAKERGRADVRAMHLSQQQRHLQVNGHMNHLSQLEQNAISMDSQAHDAVSEADGIGARLKLEINRVAIDRRTTWNSSIKTIASSMKAACSERVAIWESTLEAFETLVKQDNQS